MEDNTKDETMAEDENAPETSKPAAMEEDESNDYDFKVDYLKKGSTPMDDDHADDDDSSAEENDNIKSESSDDGEAANETPDA